MSDKHDSLERLKAKYLEEIAAEESKIDALKTKVSLIEELQAESAALDAERKANGKYAKMHLQDAALDAVATIAKDAGVVASRVKMHLLAQGFKTKSKTFGTAVGVALKRLAAADKIMTEKDNGSRLYKAKP